MPFEGLTSRHTMNLPDLPSRWLPLIHAYDPDLPLFPIYYFHALPAGMATNHRPTQSERVFGYIERVNITENGDVSVTVVTNKDLRQAQNLSYLEAATHLVRERLGVNDAVTKSDVTNCFSAPLDYANAVLGETWERVVADAYGNRLPFGRLWDEVLGLARFVASWNSQSGRKGELIQTHYFASRFGTRIQAGGGIPQVDFFLLPTIAELQDASNPLTHFPEFRLLTELAAEFRRLFCADMDIEGIRFSKFRNPRGGKFDTAGFFDLVGQLNFALRPIATECFNTFGKGPPRTVIFLLMLADLRSGAVSPGTFTSVQCGALYDQLRGAYQSSKVLEIYAQQCFGNPAALPIDTWIATFLRWPLTVWPKGRERDPHRALFAQSRNLGKVERLIWIAAQARKVHSSACNDALWCLKKSSGEEEADTTARGANPLACNICLRAIRDACPAFQSIRTLRVCFNRPRTADDAFSVRTSADDNATPNQSFLSCNGKSIYGDIVDDFSPRDDPAGFAPYPDPQHGGSDISVDEFVRIY